MLINTQNIITMVFLIFQTLIGEIMPLRQIVVTVE